MKPGWKRGKKPPLWVTSAAPLLFAATDATAHVDPAIRALKQPQRCPSIGDGALIMGSGWEGRVCRSRAGCRRCCCPSHAGVHGVHLAGGRLALGLRKPLGLPAAAGVCQERVGVVSWLAIAGGLRGVLQHGDTAGEMNADSGVGFHPVGPGISAGDDVW